MSKRPWPGDAVMVVCPNVGEEVRDAAFPTADRTCRDCGQPVRVRLQSIQYAEDMPARKGRPVDFFCIGCATQYDATKIDTLTDLRQPSSPNGV